MLNAHLIHTEDETFDALWSFIVTLLGEEYIDNIFKGYQNLTATPVGTYAVLSPGIKVRLNQGARTYDAHEGTVSLQRNTEYVYQLDCYGPDAPDWADIVAIAWRSMRACDMLAHTDVTPLYADEPVQLNFVNGERQYEQRFMVNLHVQVNQIVIVEQAFMDRIELTIPPPVDVRDDKAV